MSRLFLVFFKNYQFFPVSNEYFFTNIKFYYCISTLVHGSKSVKEGKLPSTKKHLGKSIEERPEESNNRSRFGDWGIDSVLGGKTIGEPSILTLVER